MPTLSVLDWDSSFLGCKTARLDSGGQAISGEQLDECLVKAESDGVELVYYGAPNKPGRLVLNDHWIGGEPIEEKVTYALTDFGEVPDTYADGIRTFEQSDRDGIIALALRSGYLSRFRVDPEMERRCTPVDEPSVADRLYTQWALRSMDLTMADEIFVIGEVGEIVGMIAMSATDGVARMTIAGVDPRCGGRGLGTKLVRAVQTWAKARGEAKLIVVTQRDNRFACALYDKTGFTECASEHFYHFWRRQ